MTEADKTAEEIVSTHSQITLLLEQDKRRAPKAEFAKLFRLVQRYRDQMDGATMIHRSVASAISGFREYLMLYERRLPDGWLAEADRMETMVFSGYDSHFEGFEPPGL